MHRDRTLVGAGRPPHNAIKSRLPMPESSHPAGLESRRLIPRYCRQDEKHIQVMGRSVYGALLLSGLRSANTGLWAVGCGLRVAGGIGWLGHWRGASYGRVF